MRLLYVLLALPVFAASQTCSLTQLTPAEPFRVLEGEPATDSDTFQAFPLTLGANDRVYFADSTARLRTIDADGRLRTLAGNGRRGTLQLGAALATPMPTVTQIAVSPAGVVHFSSVGRVYRIEDGRIVAVAGSGRPGFNGESAPPLELNLGTVVHFAFDSAGVLLLVDGFLRVRRLDPDGQLRTFAGSTAQYEFGVSNGDGGPATGVAFQVLRQVIPLRNGTVWIRDLRTLHAVTADGLIRVLNNNLDPAAEILLTPEGAPVSAAANRVTPLDANGQDAFPGLFPGFTGNPRAIGSSGLYAASANNTLAAALFLWREGASTLLAAAPRRAPTSGASSDAFAAWVPQTSSLIYRGTLDGVSGIVEARAGQPLRLLAGGGTDTGDPEGKPLPAIALGINAFTSDNDGRLLLLDFSRQRVLITAADGTVTTLKDSRQQPVAVALASGSLSNTQRIAVDAAGNIYWALPLPPAAGLASGQIFVWTRSTASVTTYAVVGLDGITRLPNGNVAAIAGPSFFERTLRRLEATRLGEVESGLTGTTFQSATLVGDTPYFANVPRLFRGRTGSIEAFTGLAFPSDTARVFGVTYVLADARGLIVRATDNAFYRLENPDACTREPQPKIAEGGVLNSAGFGHPDAVSPWQLLTLFGSGLGPAAGQGITLDGYARAAGQPAPHPNLFLGLRMMNGGLAGFSLPVIFANDTQMTVQVPFLGVNELVLFWSWNGLTLTYPRPITLRTATPGIFVQGSGRDGLAAALNQDGSLNSPQRAAAKGSIVQFYLTGLGGVQPPLAGPGAFNSAASLQRTQVPVTARIAGLNATVEFAGAAPGFIGGLYQVNVRIPASSPSGSQSVDFEVAGATTSAFQKVTILVE